MTKNDTITDHLMQAFLVQERTLPEFCFYEIVKMQPTTPKRYKRDNINGDVH